MPGLSRFDFYPRDWHLDTRDLTQAAKGVYIDLLASMYVRGGPLPMDEHELCRLCGCATVRSLRPLLAELVEKGKLRVVDDHLVNNRAMEEIAKAAVRQAVARQGGNAKASSGVQAEYELNTSRTQPETRNDFQQNQGSSVCSPSPSPPVGKYPSTKDAVPAPLDRKKPVYDFGKQVLGNSSGGQVTNLIRHCRGDLAVALRALEQASAKSNPREYLAAILAGERHPETDWELEYRRMGVS